MLPPKAKANKAFRDFSNMLLCVKRVIEKFTRCKSRYPRLELNRKQNAVHS